MQDFRLSIVRPKPDVYRHLTRRTMKNQVMWETEDKIQLISVSKEMERIILEKRRSPHLVSEVGDIVTAVLAN